MSAWPTGVFAGVDHDGSFQFRPVAGGGPPQHHGKHRLQDDRLSNSTADVHPGTTSWAWNASSARGGRHISAA